MRGRSLAAITSCCHTEKSRRQRDRSTHITLKRLLSGVGSHVLIQASLLTESLVTLWTLVRLFLYGMTTVSESEWKWANAEPRSLKEWNSMLDGASFIFSLRDYSQWKQQKTTFKWLSESWESCVLTVSTSTPTYELIICSSLSIPAILGVWFS